GWRRTSFRHPSHCYSGRSRRSVSELLVHSKLEFNDRGCRFLRRLVLPFADCVFGGWDQQWVPSKWLHRLHLAVRGNFYLQTHRTACVYTLGQLGIHRRNTLLDLAISLLGESYETSDQDGYECEVPDCSRTCRH